MVNVGESVNMGGHIVTRLPGRTRSKEPWQYECGDCGVHGDHVLFNVGTYGCPGRPESLCETGLSVKAGDFQAARAAEQYLRFAHKIYMTVHDWTVHNPGTAGVVATFRHENGQRYEVRMTEYGKITAHVADK